MFDERKKELYVSSVKEDNIFQREQEKEYTTSGNGAYKTSTTGNVFVDDFGNIARYKEARPIKEVFQTMNELWSVDPITTLKESVYIRLITRNPVLFSGKKLDVQRGQGLRAEYFSRMMWLAVYQPATFKKNIDILIAVGSWKDVFDLMRLDLSYEHKNISHALDWNFLVKFLMNGLADENQANLIKKYLPQIKSAKDCTTLRNQENNYIAKYIANKMFKGERNEKYKLYRKVKSSGTAHEWQKYISQQKFDKIDFNKVAGRALKLLTDGKFLENHGLETKFYDWIMSQPIAKFTGFPYELFTNSSAKNYQKEITNKQFLGLIKTAKQDMDRNSNFIVCLDSSGSMQAMATGANVSALHVAKSMALYFSYLLKGKFAKTFLEFNSTVTVQQWQGRNPYDNFFNTSLSGYCGSTNFLEVANTLVTLKNKGYEESEFPTGVLCISDGEFDRNTSYNLYWKDELTTSVKQTTFEQFKTILRNGGFSNEFVDNFKLVLWDIPNGYYGREKSVFEGYAETPNFFYMSGFDPSGIAFLTGKEMKEKPAPKNALELFQAAMEQEILGMLRI